MSAAPDAPARRYGGPVSRQVKGLPSSSPGTVAVLTALITEGAQSRADLARSTGLTSAAVTKVVNPLTTAGYLREVGPTGTGGLGRPASRVEVVGDAAFVVGLKVTGSEVLGVLVDLSGHVRGVASQELETHEVEHVLDVIVEVTEKLCADPEHASRLRHVGIGISGGVDDTGLVSYSHFLGWHGVRLAPLVHGRLGLPVAVDNDVRALTAGERWFGAGVGRTSFAVVTVGAGIGCALSYQGQLLAGVHGVSGELGHLPVAGDRPCHCGGHGCLDTVATTPSLLRDVEAVTGAPVATLEDAVALAADDERVAEVFRDAGHALGRGIASVVNLFGPQSVVLTGEGLVALDVIRESMRAGYVEQAYGQAIHAELIVRPLPFEAWAHGAATLALQAFLHGGER
ncbi:ROK family protein [Nocardioides fonticola]|uniref:ROK family protein n=1 Tax=Nocardioides fonticola TaxID=450363 RepID=A0ABP7XBA4_9ACTN